jgi:DNA-binding CsgD family transcriptional regulator
MASLHAWALAGYQSARGEADAARTTLRTATEAPGTPVYIGLLLSRLAELELSQGHPDQAEAAVRLLVGAPTSDLSPWANTTLHRTVGAVRGDVDAMREAIRDAESEGLVFERARAQLAFAGLATQPDTDGLVEAHQTFAHLGTHGLRRLAAAQLRQLGAKVPRARSRAAGLLTESEERVARLVQQGMRNREIAAALHFSPRSIEVYLSRIYAKLRVSSRLELARALDAMDPPT